MTVEPLPVLYRSKCQLENEFLSFKMRHIRPSPDSVFNVAQLLTREQISLLCNELRHMLEMDSFVLHSATMHSPKITGLKVG